MTDTKNSPPEWQQLEELVAVIQRQLAPGAIVRHNVSLPGHDSERDRQIDVLVEQQIGQFHMQIVIDCKDYKKPVDVKGVEEFIGLVKDVRAHQGCLVAARGFTKSAKKVAKRANIANIALYSPVDTGNHKWKASVSLPVLCEFRGPAMSFSIQCSAPNPVKIEGDFLTAMMVCDKNGNVLGTCVDTALGKWNDGEFPVEIGKHENQPLFPVQPYVDNGYGMQIPVDLSVSLWVEGRRYFGHLPLHEICGLKDEHSGAVYTNAFKTGVLSAVQVENQWQRLADGEELPGPVTLSVMGLDCYEIQGRRVR